MSMRTPFIRFSTKDQVLFSKRLAFLMHAGVGIHESLIIIRNQTTSHALQNVFDTIIHDIAAGQFLSKSLGKYPRLFGEFTINLIKVGENSGTLPENLTHIAEELSKKQHLQQKVRGALIYPAFITAATLGVTSMLILFIFPKIMPIFISLNITLPPTTKALLATSTFLSQSGLLTLLLIIFTIIVFEVSRRTFPTIKHTTDRVLLSIPIVGTITRSYNCANFCRTMSLTIKSGIPLSEALSITADTTQNSLYKNAYRDFATHVLKGEKISSTMVRYPQIFPDILSHMIHIGETTGSLSQSLHYLSQMYESEVDELTKNLSSSVEPLLLMSMGILVGFIAISVISPIYEVTKYIGNAR
jgi:type IV pilus assembly protein PilC